MKACSARREHRKRSPPAGCPLHDLRLGPAHHPAPGFPPRAIRTASRPSRPTRVIASSCSSDSLARAACGRRPPQGTPTQPARRFAGVPPEALAELPPASSERGRAKAAPARTLSASSSPRRERATEALAESPPTCIERGRRHGFGCRSSPLDRSSHRRGGCRHRARTSAAAERARGWLRMNALRKQHAASRACPPKRSQNCRRRGSSAGGTAVLAGVAGPTHAPYFVTVLDGVHATAYPPQERRSLLCGRGHYSLNQ